MIIFKRYTWLTVLLAASVSSCDVATDSNPQEMADTIFTNAKVFTADKEQPWVKSVAIKNGKFIHVGNEAETLKYRSENTRVTDLQGRLVLPGMIDSHAHPGYIGVEQFGKITPTTSEKEMLSAVKTYADDHPDEEIIRICCWPIDMYVRGAEGPNKAVLDAILPDRPVWFTSNAWHDRWLNSKALEDLGVNKDTADPLPGIVNYVRDENGEPTGWVKEGAGWQHFSEQFPVESDIDKRMHEEAIVEAIEALSEYGITTLYDGGNFGYEDQVYAFLSKLEKEGKLPVRYEGTYQIYTPDRTEHAISEMKRYRSAYGGERLQFNTIKLFMDGINLNRSAAMAEPYVDNPDYIARTMLSVEQLQDFLIELDQEKMDLHIHTMGDLAVSTVIDAVEAAQNTLKDGFYPRVTVSHLQLINPDDFSRIKDLGIISNFTPWWLGVNKDDVVEVSLGADRYANMYQPKSLIDVGAIVTFSSDEWWGEDLLTASLSPYLGIQVGNTRQYPREWPDYDENEIRLPVSERLDIESLILGYTINGAYQMRMEDEIGSIEVGKRSDLLVFDQNLFEIDPYEIWKIKPSMVMMEGNLIGGSLPE